MNTMGQISAFILGQAQRSFHDEKAVDHPLELMKGSAVKALQDAGIEPEAVEGIGCVDPFSWTYSDLAAQVTNGIGCGNNVREFWLPAGGTTPQDLLHEITIAMSKGELDVALIVGAEAMRTRRKASRAGETLAWPTRDKSLSPTRGQKPFTSDWEAKHGLRLPIQSFPMNENALRHDNGRSAEAQIQLAAELLHKNAQVAATNPHAWFQDAPSAEAIGTVSADNRMIAYPYTKRMNAIMDVDQAAALVVVSDRYLEKTGQHDRAVAVLGGAGAEEIWNPIERPNFAKSLPMKEVFSWALESAGLSIDDIHAFDLYSCFPAPVQMALAALGVEVDDPRDFSITGGLAYAGGPGNNYVMHSLATAVSRIRENPNQPLLITGVGMANTKHSGTVLSSASNIPTNATGKTVYRLETGEVATPVREQASGSATIVTYTIEYDRDRAPHNVIYLLDNPDGSRSIANARDPQLAADALLGEDPIGRRGSLEWDAEDELQYFSL
jgi:acetyl-CoA C-acetyltransferase